ncbi:MAG: glycoside hydrolase family 127 protein, partial [Anaerolineaceae bacterium]|nr:glycoside hydrolase family 127 protein [Anaerolineaceae bacterium]
STASVRLNLGGWVGRCLNAVTEHWLLAAPLANPAMLEMFADRDTPPYRSMMPWAGEFAGKYLTAAVQVYRVTRDPRLMSFLQSFVARLIQLQAADGYLGPWPEDSRLTNFSSHHEQNGLNTWDTWGHYHMMTGLQLWYEETGDRNALDSACRIGDLICKKYLGNPTPRLVETGMTEMNLSPVHSLAKLYRITGTTRYLEMAQQIVDEFSAEDGSGPLAGDYFRLALDGKSLHEMPRPRWESLHAILSLVEFYRISGDEKFRTAFENIWWGIVEYDRHNNGGFSSAEQAVGNPYDPGAIETCCTIAWSVLSAEMLKITRNSIVADEMELTFFNSILGMHSPSGRWATYNTPMDGARFASSHAIVFQARSGSPELNCCSVNSPRGLGLLSEWALMQDPDGFTLNYYGPATMQAYLPGGVTVELRQQTAYPAADTVSLQVSPSEPAAFTLRLRVPYWSQETQIFLNGEAQSGICRGSYFAIRREWLAGDHITIQLDFSVHYWVGERQCQGLTSIYRGPVLLAYDQRYNRHLCNAETTARIPDDSFQVTRDLLSAPAFELGALEVQSPAEEDWQPPMLLVKARTQEGEPVYLCDFASAGATGTLYRTWLHIPAAHEGALFARSNPLRSWRI